MQPLLQKSVERNSTLPVLCLNAFMDISLPQRSWIIRHKAFITPYSRKICWQGWVLCQLRSFNLNIWWTAFVYLSNRKNFVHLHYYIYIEIPQYARQFCTLLLLHEINSWRTTESNNCLCLKVKMKTPKPTKQHIVPTDSWHFLSDIHKFLKTLPC